MSLLADLLSKIKHSQSKREIPPNLRHIVSSSAQQSARKRKIILISIFFIAAVVAGIFAIYFMNSITGMLNKGQGLGVTEQVGTSRFRGSEVRKQEETGNWKPGTGNQQSEVRSQNLPTGQADIEDKKLGRWEDERLENTTPQSPNPEPRTSNASISNTSSTKEIAGRKDIISDDSQIPPAPSKDKNPAQIDAYLYSARNHEIKKDYSKALFDYRKVLELDKNNFTVMNNIAYILLQIGLISESIEYSQMAVNIKKDYVPALINLAVGNARTGNTSAAETYLNSALMIEPDNQSVLLNYAVLYEKKGDYPRASEYFLKLNRLGNVPGSLGLARIYEKQDKKEEALKIYKNIYSLNFIDNETRQIVRQRIILLSESKGSILSY